MLASRDILTVEQCQKRYCTVTFNASNTSFDYPDAFVRSRRIKYIHVIAAHLFVDDADEANAFIRPTCYSLHASFVQDDIDYMDHFVCMLNIPLYQRKKYEQFNSVKSFNIWLKDSITGNVVTLDSSAKVVLELMLEF